MTAQSNFPMNDLVLRLTGGQRDGELIPVKTQKCFLGIDANLENGVVDQPQCAIFRGTNGVAVRSYGDGLSINGVATTVHWLKEGDRIEFPNSMTVEVAQLGWMEETCEKHDVAEKEFNDPEPECCQPHVQGNCPALCDLPVEFENADDQIASESEPPSMPEMVANESQLGGEAQLPNDEDSWHEMIESQLNDIRSQTGQTQQRFDQLECQLATLSDQISQLVSLSGPKITDALPVLDNAIQDEITDRDLTEPSNDQPADEQPRESFETLTHGLDEIADSFADDSKAEASEAVELGILASQRLSDDISENPQPDEDQVEVIEKVVNVAEPSEEEVEESTPHQSSSVADLLARMNAEGQWDGIPHDDGTVEPAPEPVVETSVDPAEPVHSDEPEGNVDDYMSRLLNRMRGDNEAASQSKTADTPSASKTNAEQDSEKVKFVAPASPLLPEEFKPARKAQRIDLGAMRELANSTSRRAVHISERVRLKELGYIQIGIGVCSFFMSIYYLLVNSKAFMDLGFFVGLVCLGIAGFLGYRFFSTMKYNEMVESDATEGKANDTEKPAAK